MLRQSGIKYNHIIAMLLMAVVIFMPFGGRGVTVNARSDLAVKSVRVASPCQQSKVNQSAFSNFCQSQAGAAHLYCLLSDFVTFFTSITGKIYFLFIAGLLAASQHRRIFKPPRIIFA